MELEMFEKASILTTSYYTNYTTQHNTSPHHTTPHHMMDWLQVPQENVPPEKEREIISAMLRAMERVTGENGWLDIPRYEWGWCRLDVNVPYSTFFV